jgi:hypothetical protein
VTGLTVAAELETRAQLMFEDAYGGMKKGFRPVTHTRRGRRMRYSSNGYGAGCNMAFRRDALVEIGGFDPALDVGTPSNGGGDLDALQRVLEADRVLVYRPDAIVRHIHRRTKGRLRRQLFDNGRGYSAAIWAAFLRQRGRERLAVLGAYWTMLRWWTFPCLWQRVRGRSSLPASLVLIELAGVPLGPGSYWLARRRDRRIEPASEAK